MAEVATRSVPNSVVLQDCLGDVDHHVRTVLRTANRGSPSGVDVVERAYDALGAIILTRPHLAQIEGWLMRNLVAATPTTPGKRYETPKADTKFRYTDLPQFGLADVILCAGTRMGIDKIGHFFQLGYEYYVRSTPGAARRYGHDSELGWFGISSTGVYSRGDLEANEAGGRFWRQLRRTPTMTFSLANYITTDWDERQNESLYSGEVGRQVWRALLEGHWVGEFQPASGGGPIPIRALFSNVTESGAEVGFRYADGSGQVEGGAWCRTIHQTNSDGLVRGIRLEYAWRSGANEGRGSWESQSETHLEGRWGNGSSDTDGGIWRLYKEEPSAPAAATTGT